MLDGIRKKRMKKNSTRQTMTIKLDGVPYQLQAPDVDGDGKRGGVEILPHRIDNDTQMVVQPTELGETLRDFNKDEVDPDTRMTSIDLKTRIFNTYERNAMMAVDSLVAMKFLPKNCLIITRQAKRLNVSFKGEGRKEIVDIVAGKRDHDQKMAGGGMFDGVKNFFGGGK